MTDGIETTLKEEDGMLSVEVTASRDHRSLDGPSVIETPVVIANVDIRNDEDTVKAVIDRLAEWYAEQQDAQSHPEKSISQKMDEVYD